MRVPPRQRRKRRKRKRQKPPLSSKTCPPTSAVSHTSESTLSVHHFEWSVQLLDWWIQPVESGVLLLSCFFGILTQQPCSVNVSDVGNAQPYSAGSRNQTSATHVLLLQHLLKSAKELPLCAKQFSERLYMSLERCIRVSVYLLMVQIRVHCMCLHSSHYWKISCPFQRGFRGMDHLWRSKFGHPSTGGTIRLLIIIRTKQAPNVLERRGITYVSFRT